MRVLKVMPGVNPSAGAERSFAHTATGLLEAGIELHLVVFTDRQGLVPYLEEAGVVVHDHSSATTLRQRYRTLRQVIGAVRPDVVHASLWEAAVPAQLAAWRSGVPVLVTWAAVGYSSGHGGGAAAWKLRVVRRLDRRVARLGTCWFHAVTTGVADANRRSLGVDPERVRVVERGRPDHVPVPGALERLRAELGLASDDRVVLAVGRHEPVKDHRTLVRAAVRARSQCPGLRVLVAGREGSATAALRAEIDRGGAADLVRLLGQRDDVADLLSLADVFVLSSRSEGAAGSVIEAFRAGTAVVATDVEGLRGVLVDGVNARVVPIGDDAALADAVVEVLGDAELAGRLGAAGRRTFEERFTLERCVGEMAALYREVAASAPEVRTPQKSSRSP